MEKDNFIVMFARYGGKGFAAYGRVYRVYAE